MKATVDRRAPKQVDLHVGARIRLRRKMLGMRHEQLACTIKLTFQQVQKYERGSNRVSASKLYDMAKALQVPVTFFFEGLADPTSDNAPHPSATANRAVTDFINTTEGLELAQIFPKVRPASVRRRILDLAQLVADLNK